MVRKPSPDDLYPYCHQRKRVRINGVLVEHVLGDLENLDDSIVSNIASFLPREHFNKLCCTSKKVKGMCNHTRGQRKLDIVPTYDMHRIPDRIVRSLQRIEFPKRMAVGEITMNLLLEGSFPYFNDPPEETTIDLVQAAFNAGLNTAGSAFEEATKLTIDGDAGRMDLANSCTTALYCANNFALLPNFDTIYFERRWIRGNQRHY